MDERAEVEALLPLTDLAFTILVSLAAGPLHGYGLIKALRELKGRKSLRTGTVYAALARLEEDGLLEEVDPPADGDRRRRYYDLTPRGSSAARAEALRLDGVLGLARERDLLQGSGS